VADKIDAFAATAIGSRTAADGNPAVEAVAFELGQNAMVPVGAFSFAKGNHSLLQDLNAHTRLPMKCINSTLHQM